MRATTLFTVSIFLLLNELLVCWKGDHGRVSFVADNIYVSTAPMFSLKRIVRQH
jgi:hypothetical protein